MEILQNTATVRDCGLKGAGLNLHLTSVGLHHNIGVCRACPLQPPSLLLQTWLRRRPILTKLFLCLLPSSTTFVLYSPPPSAYRDTLSSAVVAHNPPTNTRPTIPSTLVEARLTFLTAPVLLALLASSPELSHSGIQRPPHVYSHCYSRGPSSVCFRHGHEEQ